MAVKLRKIPTFLQILIPIWALCGVASEESSSLDCSTLVVGMAACLSYVSSGSSLKKPEGSCCSGLKTVIKTDAECLCEAFQNSAQFGVSLNITKAMSLPSACHISAPAFTTCGVNVVPGAAPAPSPMTSPPSTIPDSPSIIVGGGSEVAPSRAIGSSSAPAVSVLCGALVLSMLAAVSLYLS